MARGQLDLGGAPLPLRLNLGRGSSAQPGSGLVVDGLAAEVHIRGEGPAVLTRRDAFSAPHAARVALTDAQVGRGKPGTIDLPAGGAAWDAGCDVVWGADPKLITLHPAAPSPS